MSLPLNNTRNIAAAWLLGACTSGSVADLNSTPNVEPVTPEPLAELPAPRARAFATSKDAAWVFDESQVRTYELELGPTAWEELKAHALDEQYTPATLIINEQAVGVVGLRFKGNAGTLQRCVSGSRLVCAKLSMKLRFDEYDPERRFYGLKRLNFNSMLSDPSQLRERLAYKMFREMGVTAPQATHARLVVNGEALGVFSLVEEVDGRFTDQHFDAGDGNLYKEQWPNTDSAEVLGGRLETNEETADHSGMIELYQQLSAAAPEELAGLVERYTEVESLLAYFAVDRAIKNWDGVASFYCRGRGACRNHNYYLYQHEARPYFSLIPWDLDNTFRVQTSLDYVPSTRVVPADCAARYPVFGDLIVLAPGCDPLLQGLARLEAERHQAQLTRLLDGPFALEPLLSWVDATATQLAPHVAADDRGPGPLAFEREVEALRRELRLLHLRVVAEQQGEPLALVRLDVNTQNDFEAATPAGVQLGVLGRSPAASHFEVGLREGQELGGSRHLQLSFDLKDDLQPRDQWVRYTLPFNSPDPFDLNGKQALRLRLQSSSARKVRISFASSGYSQYLSVDTFGWTVETTGAVQVLTLPVQSAALPEGVTLPETLADVLLYANGILIDPIVEGLGEDGYLGPGRSDIGWLRIDDIELLSAPESEAPEGPEGNAPEDDGPGAPEPATPDDVGTPDFEVETPDVPQR
ncbi:MAG: hypothetical protein RL685_3554 [Pseudomonadota bacterium]